MVSSREEAEAKETRIIITDSSTLNASLIIVLVLVSWIFRGFELMVKLETSFFIAKLKLEGLSHDEAASKYAYLPR